ETLLTAIQPDSHVCSRLENAYAEAAGAGSRPILLTLVGLRPPAVSKIALLNLKLCRVFVVSHH
ncbi:MAG: hypothetical protein PUB32_05075, partial [Clostridiales bacterium]|nr:hypothetical protein [Clostridiales bacterium]